MGFRIPLLLLFIFLNLFSYLALRRAVTAWSGVAERRRSILLAVTVIVVLLNVPLGVFFIRPLDGSLHQVPTTALRVLFYPSMVWLATIIAFFLIAAPPTLLWTLAKGLRIMVRQGIAAVAGTPPPVPQKAPALSRRSLLAGGAGLLIPGIYGVAAYGVYGNLDEIDVSRERSIPIPHLPRSLEGLKIVQLSDLHVGPYIRERELSHVVHLTNQLRPDLIVITGDILDRHLSSLPETVRGLAALRAPLGVFTVLGNHDIYSDPTSFSKLHRGGIRIAEGLESAGIQTLRNQVARLGSGTDRLALMGLDWLTANPGDRNFYRYRPEETRRQLRQMAEQAGPETPTILLAHHPDTFEDAVDFQIGLTLAGHTHGGGQVILGFVGGVPIGIATFRFKYLSGLYQEQGCSLYVNRGIGYLGIPIRINCPPEISRFKLVRPRPPEAPGAARQRG